MKDSSTIEELDALGAKGDIAKSESEGAVAAASLENLVRNRAGNAEPKYKLADAYVDLGRSSEAFGILNRPSTVGQGNARQSLIGMCMKAKKFAAAIPILGEFIAAEPDIQKPDQRNSISEADSRLKEGRALFAADRLVDAERVFLELLIDHPSNPQANSQLGQIYIRQKRWADAIRVFRDSLAIEPRNNNIKPGLARALLNDGLPQEALEVLWSLDDHDSNPQHLYLAQRCHRRLRNWSQVEKVGTRLLEIVSQEDPLRPLAEDFRRAALVEMEVTRINATREAGDVDGSISAYQDVANRYPESPLVWLKLGTALMHAERNDDAVVALRTALDLSPEDTKIREALSRAIIRSTEQDGVLEYIQSAIAAGTADFECHRWLVQYYNANHNWPLVLESARNALAINPTHVPTRIMNARALMRLSRLPEALDELNALPSRGSKAVVVLQLKADIFVRLGRLDDAIDLYKQALRHAPRHPLLNHRLSYAYLLKGDVGGFHRLHEMRRNGKTFIESNKEYLYVDWNGELSIEGKLLVWSEVGLGVGQNILHMTFLKSLVALGLEVVFEVEQRLVETCRRSFPEITVIADNEEPPEGISHHTPIGSLSRWFKPDLASFATMRPFLLPDAQVVAGQRKRLQDAAGEGSLLVGVSWTSNNPFVGDVKSVPLQKMLEAISLPGVTLVNLQYGDHSQSIAQAESETGKRLADSGIDNSNDLDGLAAVIAAMDLVVCIGHTTAHIAGAIGTPNFVLLPAGPFAHWLAQGEQCIWYPASTLFRQAPIDEDWAPVLEQVSNAVREFTNSYDQKSWLNATLIPNLSPLPAFAEKMSSQDICYAVHAFADQRAYRSALQLMDRLPQDQLTRELEILRADMLGMIGHWDEANLLLLSFASDEDGATIVDRKLLSNLLATYDLESALIVARRLADEEATYGLIAANVLYHLRRHDEALAELRAVSMRAPQAKGLSTLTGTVLLEMGAYERAEAYLAEQAAMTRLPQDYSLLGQAMSSQGRREDALAAYEKCLALSRFNPAANFWRTQERIELGLAARVPLPPLMGDLPTVETDDAVIFFAADSKFFWQHGLVLLGSIGRNAPQAKCHVHVINPDAGVSRAIQLIRDTLPELSLSFSYEEIDFEGCSDLHIRTYYASARFVRLAEIFAQSPAIYLCLDADCIVRADITARQLGDNGADVSLHMRYHDWPHLAVLASASIWRPTDAAAEFLSMVSKLVRSALEAREAVWFLDQIVLGHALRELGSGEVRVGQMEQTYLDWFFHDDGMIWTGKGKRKSDDSRYKLELAKYSYLQELQEITEIMPQIVIGVDGSVDFEDMT